MTNAPIFEMSADARFLYQELRAAKVGDVVSYEMLTNAIGKSVVGGMSALRTAIKSALRDDGTVFACIKKVGVKRLNDSDIVSLGESETAGTRRRVKRTVRKLTSIGDFSALTPATQLRHTALVSINAMIADTTREPSIKKVADASQGRASELPIRETLKAMGFGS